MIQNLLSVPAFLLLITVIGSCSSGKSQSDLLIDKNTRIVISDQEEAPLIMAFNAFKEDFDSVFGTEPGVFSKPNSSRSVTEIVIVNLASGKTQIQDNQLRPLDGWESHRVYADPETNRIYLIGNDLRGTIYAMFTFSENLLGVPPLKYWCSWKPEKKKEIRIPSDFDLFFKTPQVRYRSLLPGDQDFFNPWRKESPENDHIWLETALRLKLNTVETYSTILPGYKLTDYAYLIDSFGLVITSHHTSGLNTSFRTWGDYWREMRNMEPPAYMLSNEQELKDFFRYNAETVKRSGIENLWTVAFRGETDQPFWSIFEDAPKDDKGRADVINQMLQIQYDLIKEMTGEDEPYARITFYDELAILMAKGLLRPPDSKNMIWTFVAGRRDHYPYEDIVNFDASENVKLGYYMNFGFASTGAHIAPAEGPWKMEFNYRFVNNKAPLFFSVVNVGNFREFVLELSANARMLWDYDNYDTDQFMLDYCTMYFGAAHAQQLADLYKDFYHAYWNQKKSEFEGLERQFVFQDLRYARVFDQINNVFFSTGEKVNMNPLWEIGYESVPGRTFRLDLNYNHAENQVDALLNGMELTIPKFESIAMRCDSMVQNLDKEKQPFFNDNLRIFSYYMAGISKSLYHYVLAYKLQKDKDRLVSNLRESYNEAARARQFLYEGQHGIFSTWYSNAEPMTRTFQIDSLMKDITNLIDQADSAR